MQPADGSSQPPPDSEPFHEKLRGKLTEYLLLALPIALVNALIVWVMNRFFSQPWQAVWFVIPLVILGWVAWKRLTGNQSLRLGKPFLILLAIYTLIFSLSAGTEFLNWKRTLFGYEQTVPRNFLSLNWAGDWRYRFARKTPIDTDFAVVTMPPPQTLAAGRFDTSRLIKLALLNHAKGIAFDSYFNDNSDPQMDAFLCTQIKDAVSKQMPVFVGYGFHFINNDPEPIRDPIAPSLSACLPDANQGHLVGYSESDGKIRLVPLYFKKDPANESLSLKISKALQKDIQLPENGLVQFVKAQTDFPEIRYEDLIASPDQRSRLIDKFVLVGERSPQDTFQTPYGLLPGVTIHSFVIHSLRHNHYIQRVPWWSSFLIVFVSCYLITLFFAQKWRLGKIVLMTFVVSIGICLISILAITFWLVWLDVIYPLLAGWLLLLLLLILSRLFKAKAATA